MDNSRADRADNVLLGRGGVPDLLREKQEMVRELPGRAGLKGDAGGGVSFQGQEHVPLAQHDGNTRPSCGISRDQSRNHNAR